MHLSNRNHVTRALRVAAIALPISVAAVLPFLSVSAQGAAVVAGSGSEKSVNANVPLDVADSAALARTHYRSARESLMQNDTTRALEMLDKAATAFPSQPTYAGALWMLARRAKNASMADRAIGIANRIGLALPDAASMSQDGGMSSPNARLLQTQRELSKVINAGELFHTASDKRLFPEGIAFDIRTRTIYLSSLSRRTISALSDDGKEHVLNTNIPRDIGGLYGIVVDTARNLIWAASAQSPVTKSWNVADSTLSALVAFDLRTGAIARRIALRGTPLPPSPGDIALGKNGDVFVADGQAGVIWWLKNGESNARMLRHKLYRSPQGMVVSDDGRALWVADYSHGLLKTNLPDGSTSRVADISGMSTVGIDGLTRSGMHFIAVQNASNPAHVLRFSLNASGDRVVTADVLDRASVAVSPTGGVMVGSDYVYIANTLWDLVKPDGTLPDDAERAPVLLRVRVDSVRQR